MPEELVVPPSALAGGASSAPNLYVHFPFCRRKCTYCALYSRCGVSEAARCDYVVRLAGALRTVAASATGAGPEVCGYPACRRGGDGTYSTVYFGGGSPALCDLRPLFGALAPCLSDETEFTVELHPHDVSVETLATLKAGGVNRISMGVQSLDDATLTAMGRGYTADEAARAFALVRRQFDNAGIDLIVGFPGDPCADYRRLADFGLTHCSVYSLQNERHLKGVPDDEWTLDRLREVAAQLESLGLRRYEISNYAVTGRECRHNLATWRGEDYIGLGDGASGRLGRFRTQSWWGGPLTADAKGVSEVDAESDRTERQIFRLRTREGLDAGDRPEWWPILDEFVAEDLLEKSGTTYRLTVRGTEVCDTILTELV